VPTRTGAIPLAEARQRAEESARAQAGRAEDRSLEVPRIFDEDEDRGDDLDIPDFLR